jgi:hypothetical protein
MQASYLLSQEGCVIAFFAMTRGVVPKRNVSECILKDAALEPPSHDLDGCLDRAALVTQEGSLRASTLPLTRNYPTTSICGVPSSSIVLSMAPSGRYMVAGGVWSGCGCRCCFLGGGCRFPMAPLSGILRTSGIWMGSITIQSSATWSRNFSVMIAA